jgi:hypothetical protein
VPPKILNIHRHDRARVAYLCHAIQLSLRTMLDLLTGRAGGDSLPCFVGGEIEDVVKGVEDAGTADERQATRWVCNSSSSRRAGASS